MLNGSGVPADAAANPRKKHAKHRKLAHIICSNNIGQ